MIEYPKLRIDISDIRNGNVKCANPKITWITRAGTLFPCIGETYIEIEATPNSLGVVEFFVQCNDCDVCPPLHVKRALCNTSADCEDCEKCEDGWCKPLCPDQLCVDNTCVECITSGDCTGGKICLNGECVCPVDKPFINERGECVSCITSDNCGNCAECYNGDCVPKDCGEGACDPATGNCVGCIISGDCEGEHMCCVNKECVCCPGYVWSYEYQDCIPVDECYSDEECGDCKICVDGECTDLICPDGYICKDNQCVKLCECYGSGCPVGYVCVPYGGVCVCVKCEGECIEDGDCGEGCECINGVCTATKCYGECQNALDCGDGCGCFNGQCVDCTDLECNGDCEQTVGCECVGEKCKKVPETACSGGCVSYWDCGPGCTCYNGECVPCEYFSCEGTDCDSRPGCSCQDGRCEGNGEDRTCEDEFTFTKDNDDCNASILLLSQEECACPKISIGSFINKIVETAQASTVDFTVQLRKGEAHEWSSFAVLPLLSDESHPDIADNEEPTSGIVRISVTPTYYRLETNLSRIPNSEIIGTTVNYETLSFIGVATRSIDSVVLPKPGYKDTVALTEVKKVLVSVYLKTDMEFPNSCTYFGGQTLLGVFEYNTRTNSLNDVGFRIVETVESADTRYPLFTIYKAKNNNFTASNVFRKAYIPFSAVPGGYLDVLYGLDKIPDDGVIIPDDDGELWGNRYYFVKNDCSCDNAAELGKLVFCNPSELFYTLTNCGSRITIDSPFAPCDVNRDITVWNQPGYTIESDVQAKYNLFLNGTYRATFVDDAGTMKVNMVSPSQPGIVGPAIGSPMIGAQFTTSEPIYSIVLKINYDTEEQCTLTYPIVPDEFDVTYTTECPTTTVSYFYVHIPTTNNGKTITNVAVTNGSVETPTIPNNLKVRVNKSGNSVITVYTSDGCTSSFSVYNACCAEMVIDDFNVTYSPISSTPLVMTADITGGQAPFTYKFYWVTKLGGQGTITYTTSNTSQSHTVGANAYGAGEVRVEIVDANGCDVYATTSIGTEEYVVTVTTDVPNLCGPGNVNFYLEGTPEAIVRTSLPAPLDEVLLSVGGEAQFTVALAVTTTVNFVSIEKGGFSKTLNLSKTITYTAIPTASVSVTGAPCSSSTINLVFAGTPLSTVKYKHRKPDGSYSIAPNGTLEFEVVLDNTGAKTIAANKAFEGVNQIELVNVAVQTCSDTLTTNVPYTVTFSPTGVLSAYTCASDLTTYSVTLTTANVLNTPTATSGSVSAVSANVWLVSGIPSNTVSTITIVNGACTLDIPTAQYVCSCGSLTVPTPTPVSDLLEYCDGDIPPTMEVSLTSPAIQANWYYASSGGVPIATGLTLIPPTEPTTNITYWVEAQTAENCVSARVPIILHKRALPTATITAPTAFCAQGTQTFTCSHNGVSISWTATGGTIIGSNTNNSVSIDMPDTVGLPVVVEATVLSAYGCEKVVTSSANTETCCGGTACDVHTWEIDLDVYAAAPRITTFTSSEGTCGAFVAGLPKTTSGGYSDVWDDVATTIYNSIIACPSLGLCDTTSLEVCWTIDPGTEIFTIIVLNSPVELVSMQILSGTTYYTLPFVQDCTNTGGWYCSAPTGGTGGTA